MHTDALVLYPSLAPRLFFSWLVSYPRYVRPEAQLTRLFKSVNVRWLRFICTKIS